jgi:hypothetical protein
MFFSGHGSGTIPQSGSFGKGRAPHKINGDALLFGSKRRTAEDVAFAESISSDVEEINQ